MHFYHKIVAAVGVVAVVVGVTVEVAVVLHVVIIAVVVVVVIVFKEQWTGFGIMGKAIAHSIQNRLLYSLAKSQG